MESHQARQLAYSKGETQAGFGCNIANTLTADQLKPYDWKYCTDMYMGETYEVHWPHSNMGHCNGGWDNTANARYQTPFYDGVFCHPDAPADGGKVGVQGQVFVVVNDEDHQFP